MKMNHKDGAPAGYRFRVLILAVITVIVAIGSTSLLDAKIKMKPEQEEFYNYARYLFSKAERRIFKKLPTDKARDEFIRNFWEIRDPNPYTEENEFRMEMEKRFEHVRKYFKEGPIPGYKTDRGRIYILLGEPTTRWEQMYSFSSPVKGIVIWYFDEEDIRVTFKDTRGNGVYRISMGTRNEETSLNLLSVLENRKYFIRDKEKGNVPVENLEFKFNYDSAAKQAQLNVETKHLSFEDVDEKTVSAKLKINITIYDKDLNSTTFKDIRTVKIPKKTLLNSKARYPVTFPLTLPKGKLELDVMVTDLLGEAVQRNFIKVNVQ